MVTVRVTEIVTPESIVCEMPTVLVSVVTIMLTPQDHRFDYRNDALF
jgi:hypothetical protein